MMDNRAVARFRRFFKLGTHPVGVKILRREIRGQRPKTPSLFCDFVRRAATGEGPFVLIEEDLTNFTARVLLGFTAPKYVDIQPRVSPPETKAVVVGPLERLDEKPDVVVLVADPARLMLVIQVLKKATGRELEARMSCEASAIAGEIVARVYTTKQPNLTLLCGGARGLAGYRDSELAMGLPYEHFLAVAEHIEEPRLTKALCGCVMDEIPKHLKEAFTRMGFDKGTDHFYGEFDDKVIRVYLNKGSEGLFSVATYHYPLKCRSKEDAERVATEAETALAMLGGDSGISIRENWIDLVVIMEYPEGLEKIAVDEAKFRETIESFLKRFCGVIDRIKQKAH